MMMWVAVLLVVGVGECAPLARDHAELARALEGFLGGLYDRLHTSQEDDLYDQMQGDQPQPADADDANNVYINFLNMTDANASRNFSEMDYFRTMRNRPRDSEQDLRTRDHWIQALKENILHQIGRTNMTTKVGDSVRLNAINITAIIPQFLNASTLEDDQITEKIRSYYPSCEVPQSVEQEMWRDDNSMNLYFNFDHNSDELNIATATLRLYRILPANATKGFGIINKPADCDGAGNSTEEEKLMRVSIWWYTINTKPTKRKRVKWRLSDSKVIQESTRWVELSVKPATRALTRGRNLGLAVRVEDQEGNFLRADKYLKGTSCTVGASTPKPIPTIIMDAARQSNEFGRTHNRLGGNSSSPDNIADPPMPPSLDLCTLEFPENYSRPPPQIANLRINACNLRKVHEQNHIIDDDDRIMAQWVKLNGAMYSLPSTPSPLSHHHIRHGRQHNRNQNVPNDPRDRITNKRILTAAELQHFNITSINYR